MTRATASISGSDWGRRIAAAGNGSRVDVRSLSRVGKSDFGVNAKRIRKFIKQLAAA